MVPSSSANISKRDADVEVSEILVLAFNHETKAYMEDSSLFPRL